MAAFALDLTLAGVTVFHSVQHPHCVNVVLDPEDALWVGLFGLTPDCQVTGNPTGCAFNPTITDAQFLPPLPGEAGPVGAISVPGLSNVGLLWIFPH